MKGSFSGNTRLKHIMMDPQTPGYGKIGRWTFDKAGILAGVYLGIKGTATGTLSAPNALGFASMIRQVRCYLSTGTDLHMFSGPGYHYLMRDYIEDYKDPNVSSNARSAVTAAAFDVSMYLPFAINARDLPGLILLQQERVTLNLSVEVEALATVATGLTDGGPTITPYVEIFTVPPNPDDRPDFNLVQSFMEEVQVVGAAGDWPYPWPRGNTILSMLHGFGMGVSGADNWTKAIMRVQQNDRIDEYNPDFQDKVFERFHGRARPKGTIAYDDFGSSGLGSYGSARDAFITQNVTSAKTVLTVTGAGNLYALRRELIAVKPPE
jgi:hypothetical protein